MTIQGNTMLTKSKIHCWGIGIPQGIQTMLTEYFGQTVSLTIWPEKALPSLDAFKKINPVAIFVSPQVERTLSQVAPALQKKFFDTTRICIMPEHHTKEDLALGLGYRAPTLLPYNANKKDIWNILHMAYETRHMPEDIHFLAKELLLERELLERKNTVLSFLTAFFANTAEAKSMPSLFTQSFKAFIRLFPVKTMHVAIWTINAVGNTEASFYLNTPENSADSSQWERVLLSHVNEAVGNKHTIVKHKENMLLHKGSTIAPADIHTFPLYFGKDGGLQGIVLLGSNEQPSLGRDQSEALVTALNHLATAGTNFYLSSLAHKEASIDPLTGFNNRRHFMTTLTKEIARSKRYGHAFSLMMLDIDYFKAINDTYGHLAGDKVLQQIGQIINDALRNTDMAYRYGGEEFCILMPETPTDKAFLVAERLREKIASFSFAYGKEVIHATTSIGIASVSGKQSSSAEMLIKQADEHLYMAKANGRNCTALASALLSQQVV